MQTRDSDLLHGLMCGDFSRRLDIACSQYYVSSQILELVKERLLVVLLQHKEVDPHLKLKFTMLNWPSISSILLNLLRDQVEISLCMSQENCQQAFFDDF